MTEEIISKVYKSFQWRGDTLSEKNGDCNE